jgi:hypothetical protein
MMALPHNCGDLILIRLSSNHFLMVSTVKSVLILLPFNTIDQHHQSDTRKNISLSVTVYMYHKNLSMASQCKLTAQIEQVQDKILYPSLRRYSLEVWKVQINPI